MISKPRPDLEKLRDFFGYDPGTGEFCRKLTTGRMTAGTKVGSANHTRYHAVVFCGKRIYLHILAWALHHGEWPAGIIDHIDGDPSNNRMDNLRLATKAQNGWNRSAPRSNKTGVKGVCMSRGRYRAEISCNGKAFYIGEFRTLDEARDAYAAKAQELHGEFVRLT